MDPKEKTDLMNKIDHWFTYHPPTEEQIDQYTNIREAAKRFAQVIAANTPNSADQTVAIRKVREATMVANAAIACKGE